MASNFIDQFLSRSLSEEYSKASVLEGCALEWDALNSGRAAWRKGRGSHGRQTLLHKLSIFRHRPPRPEAVAAILNQNG